MVKGFWEKLKKPIFVLAPMANVTDQAFRTIITKYGKPDVFWTEFVSVEGFLSEGKKALLPDFWYSENQRPIVAQIFGSKPEQFELVAKELVEMGFDGIDINMGCPDKNVCKQGSGASLCKEPELTNEIILATKAGAGNTPVSVKARLGWNTNEIDTWLPVLLKASPAAIVMHARTKKQMSKVPADWSQIKKMVEITRELISEEKERPILIGNGDVLSLDDGLKKISETGVDGVMLGRAIFGNPYLFNRDKKMEDLSIKERLDILLEHTDLFEKLYGEDPRIKGFDIMKKHYKAYVNGFDGAKELRIRLMEAKDVSEIKGVIERM
ncbi:MAG: tRNA-dihydrouridine synthase [Candidatus Harrisonbacteria bacterium CG10_big_fil_rev_8_21_14_0_10_38_8]|uniref:tRNA-dihydrouridine synthase n=1 Tax=Candidatus Harrisonbacteria bacterium CG10_big_fil_rev_8_21_14_0_10_38_8 TaxID=1974582 RepID=A0A2M6WKG1_9BACT|nr:MAG: tRNA-dihydrouridine synthase [Candidatus Harrisonbacteria bacterium CG10_big_fil_rev_8_21_14_0_10_38_8]